MSTASTVYVLPDELEKHCIQLEPILDKNAWSSKKLVSAHLPMWICRRFSTGDLVLQRVWWLNLPVLHVVQQKRQRKRLCSGRVRFIRWRSRRLVIFPARSSLSAVQDRHSLRWMWDLVLPVDQSRVCRVAALPSVASDREARFFPSCPRKVASLF